MPKQSTQKKNQGQTRRLRPSQKNQNKQKLSKTPREETPYWLNA
jgi:hypothetical protein